jgi:chaperonin GroEL
MVENASRTRSPELLDDAGTIARRIIGVADRDADMGAMLLRHALWRLRGQVGDGAATATVLFEAIYREGHKYVAAGGNPMPLRAALERGLQVVHEALGRQAQPLAAAAPTRRTALVQLAETICHDAELANLLGEVMDLIGQHGYLELRTGRGRELHREYVEGAYWECGWIAPQVASDMPGREIRLHDAALLISDSQVDDVPALVRLLEMARRHDCHALVLVAHEVSDSALALLRLNRERAGVTCLPVKTPSGASTQSWALQDLAVLTGARPLVSETGATLASVAWEDLGRARRAWATADHFGLVGGGGDPSALGQHIDQLRQALPRVDDDHLRRLAQERIGRLLGGAALLWVGADTDSAISFRKDQAERTVAALRAALAGGVVPGAGVAFLAARQTLTDCWPGCRPGVVPEADRAALHILQTALAAPARAILANAGYEPSAVLPKIEAAGPPYGFDVLAGDIVDLRQAGIVDVVTVLQAALRTAISTAALALTTDVLIHAARPQQSLET